MVLVKNVAVVAEAVLPAEHSIGRERPRVSPGNHGLEMHLEIDMLNQPQSQFGILEHLISRVKQSMPEQRVFARQGAAPESLPAYDTRSLRKLVKARKRPLHQRQSLHGRVRDEVEQRHVPFAGMSPVKVKGIGDQVRPWPQVIVVEQQQRCACSLDRKVARDPRPRMSRRDELDLEAVARTRELRPRYLPSSHRQR